MKVGRKGYHCIWAGEKDMLVDNIFFGPRLAEDKECFVLGCRRPDFEDFDFVGPEERRPERQGLAKLRPG